MIFLDSLHGSRWRVILCISDLIHTTTAQYDDEGDAQGFVGVGCQGKERIGGPAMHGGTTNRYGAARCFLRAIVT